MSEWLDVLNDEQRTAVENTEGYVCLHAGAGTGKTKTLTYRYAYLISEYGISPRSVWCVTFTNKAAAEMKDRVKALCGNTIGNPFITTFHGFCASFLRDEIGVLGWPKTFSIADVNDVKEILRPLYKECGINGKELNLRKAWEYIDSTKETKDYISDFIGDDSSVLLKRSSEACEDTVKLFWRYIFAQRTTYTLDFDDLILLTLHILKNFPEIRQRWQERLEYILVDEFQDIDRDQYELVEILAGFNQNLFIVGDPDQTIYSFRGARVEYFKGFVDAHADENGLQLHLTKNYRSQGTILQAAYSVILSNLDPERKALIPMRNDISLSDMVAVIEPDYEAEDELSEAVANQIQSKSYLGSTASQIKAVASLNKPDQTLYYDPSQDPTYEAPFGDEDFSSIFEGDCSDVIPEEFSSSKVAQPMYDRLKKSVGYKKENKLRRIGINYDEDNCNDSPYASMDSQDAIASELSTGLAASVGCVGAALGGDVLGTDELGGGDQYFPPIGTATTMGRGRYGAKRAAQERFKHKKPQIAHTLKPIVAHASNSFVEARFVGRTIQDIQVLDPQASIAVLYRSHFIALVLEQELTARKIVYNMVGDLSFFDRKEIRDVIAYVRLRVNLDDDVAFRRIANVPPRRFGKKRMERLEELARHHRCSLFRALCIGIDDPFLNPGNNMSQFIDLMNKLASAPFRSPSDDLEIILNDSGYDEFLKLSGEDERLEKLASLRVYLSDFKKNHDDDVNLADFIGQISLMNSLDANHGVSPVSLMTVHNAKGLEFDYVFVISLNESIFPTKNSINEQNVAEERRLMYVAMTRACKQLIMVEAGGELLNRAKKERYTREPSRFLTELKEDDFICLGQAPEKEKPQPKFTSTSNKQNLLQVGDRFFHKILGYGHVLEVREVDGEYVVFYDKLNKQRTLSFAHAATKIERIDANGAELTSQPATATSAATDIACSSASVDPSADISLSYGTINTAGACHSADASASKSLSSMPAPMPPHHDAVTVPYETMASATMSQSTAQEAYTSQGQTKAAAMSMSVSAYSPYGDDSDDGSMSVAQFLKSVDKDQTANSDSSRSNPYAAEPSSAEPKMLDANSYRQHATAAYVSGNTAEQRDVSFVGHGYAQQQEQPSEHDATAGGYRPQPLSSYERATEKFKNAGYSYGLPSGYDLYADRHESDDEDE